MAKRELSYFMRPIEDEIVTVPAPDTFTDADGKVLDMEVKVLSQAEIMKIRDRYKNRTIVKGKNNAPYVVNGNVIWSEEYDGAKATRHIILEALQYPNLRDTALMDHYKCVDATDMPMLVFSRPDEYEHVVKVVFEALGLTKGEKEDEEDLNEAKN